MKQCAELASKECTRRPAVGVSPSSSGPLYMGFGKQTLADDSSLMVFVAVVRGTLPLGYSDQVIWKGSYFLFAFICFVADGFMKALVVSSTVHCFSLFCGYVFYLQRTP